MARLNREHEILVHEILVQERSMAAAKDAALIAFSPEIPQPQLQLLPPPPSSSNVEGPKSNNGENLLPPSSSRWPKAEVQALINLRTSLEQKYQDSGPKGPLWGGDLSIDAEAWVQSELEEVQGEVGEHQQVLQEGEGEQQEAARGLQDLPLLPPAGPAIQGEDRRQQQ
ncbi:hypothetical protein Ancab_038548 [Ancistrocladus abbreviatus]